MANAGSYVTAPTISAPFAIGGANAPWDLVTDRFETSLTKAEEMLQILIGPDGSSGYLGAMASAITAAPDVSVISPEVNTELTLKESGLTVPIFNQSALKEVVDESYSVVLESSGAVLPELDQSALKEVVDESYSVVLESSGAVAPSFDQSLLKEVVDEVYSVTLESSGLTVPEAPTNLASFPEGVAYPDPTIAELPTIDTSDLSGVFIPGQVSSNIEWAPTEIPTEIYNAIMTRMLTDLQSGATGLDPIVEHAIYDRARVRQQSARDVAYQKLNNDIAARGFSLPSGPLLSALTDFAAEGLRMDTEINNGIIVSQGELAQKNSQFMMQQAVALEQLIRNTSMEQDKTALDAAKAQATLLVQDYAERVKAFLAEWEGKKARVQAQAEALRGVIDGNKGAVETFKAQWESLRIRVDAVAAENKSTVDVFTAGVQAFSEAERAIASRNSSAVEVFKAENDSFKTRAEVVNSSNKSTVDVFTAGVQAFAEIERATASKNSSAVEVFKAENDSFKTRADVVNNSNKNVVDVFTAGVQAYAEAERATASKNNSNVEVFKEQYAAFKTRADVVINSNKGTVDVFNGQVQGYTEGEKAISMQNSSAVEVLKAQVAAAELQVQAAVANAESVIKGYTSEIGLRGQIATEMAKVAAQTVASMMAAVNASASLGFSGSSSESRSVSNAAALSESHSYEHAPTT